MLNKIKGLHSAWKRLKKITVKWVVESSKPYWRKNKLWKPRKNQIDSNKDVVDFLTQKSADVVTADAALGQDHQMPAEVSAGGLVRRAALRGAAWATRGRRHPVLMTSDVARPRASTHQ